MLSICPSITTLMFMWYKIKDTDRDILSLAIISVYIIKKVLIIKVF